MRVPAIRHRRTASVAVRLSTAGGVHQVVLPSAARRRSTLSRLDYTDGFLVETDTARRRTPEQWARVMLEGAPAIMRRTLPWGWRSLGLKHGPTRSDEFVLGWEVRRSTPDFALLGADSHFGMPAELLFECRPRALLFATLLQHDNPISRVRWSAIAPFHRQVVRYLLGQASKEVPA